MVLYTKCTVQGQAQSPEEHRSHGAFQFFFGHLWRHVMYMKTLYIYIYIVSCQTGKIKTSSGCTMNAKVVSEARENFMVYCVKGCREIQKQENQNLVIIEGSEKIIEYAKSILCAVPGLVSRLMVAEQIVCWQSVWGRLFSWRTSFSRSFDRKGRD